MFAYTPIPACTMGSEADIRRSKIPHTCHLPLFRSCQTWSQISSARTEGLPAIDVLHEHAGWRIRRDMSTGRRATVPGRRPDLAGRRYHPLVPRAFRLVLATFGVLVALYSAGSLTGHVTPPWWEREEGGWLRSVGGVYLVRQGGALVPCTEYEEVSIPRPRPGRELISIAVGAAGLAALAFAAWPCGKRGA